VSIRLKQEWASASRRLKLHLVRAGRVSEKPQAVVISAGVKHPQLLNDQPRMSQGKCFDD